MKESILSRISALLGMEKVELASMKLMDGVTVLEADAFEPGMEVFIVTEDEQRIALPVGEYELEDGRMLVVATEGVIAEIKEKAPETEVEVEAPEAPEAEAPMMEEQMAEEAPAAQPKKIIKSQVEEMLFSKIEELKAENEALKAQLSEQPVVEEAPVVEEPAAKPIAHNPEKENPTQSFQWGMGRKESTMDRILNKLNN
jgi:regulator of replication initiation timing